MKKASRSKTAAITAATLAISLLIGTGISEAMRLTSGNRGGATRATAIRAQSFGKNSIHMSINKTRMKRARVVGAQSVAREGRHNLLRGLALFGEIGHVHDYTDELPILRATREFRGNSFGVLPIHFPGRTIQWPSERIPDQSDIPGMDLEHFPGRDMINSKYLGGPDREFNYIRQDSYWDYWVGNAASDLSGRSCMWDEGTWNKASHWGGRNGNPLERDSAWNCDPAHQNNDDDKGGKDNESGGKDDSGSAADSTEQPKPTEDKVKDTEGQPDGKKDGPEGDDPDELRSPIAEEVEAIDMVSAYDSRDGSSGNSVDFPMARTGTNNTPVGLRGRTQRLGPNHKNRPDVTGSPASSLVKANSMSYAASPTPDGGSNPPPGPEYSPIASTTSAAAGSTIANRMGYAASPAIGTDGKDPGPPPGPEF